MLNTKKPFLKKDINLGGNLPKKNSILNKINALQNQNKDLNFKSTFDKNTFINKNYDRRDALQNLMLKSISIAPYSYEEMKKIKVCEITETTDSGPGSLYDERMGSYNMNVQCAYCNNYDCPGHYGLIDFGGVKIPHPMYTREIQYVLHIICGKCGCLLYDKNAMKEKGLLNLKGSKRLKALELECKKLPCTNKDSRLSSTEQNIIACGINPKYEVNKESGIFRFNHVNSKNAKGADNFDEDNIMSIDAIYDILKSISPEDAQTMGFDVGTHPKDFILQGILVCPNVARVRVEQKFSALSDKQTLTPAYKAILSKVKEIRNKSGMTKTKNLESELYRTVSAIISMKEEDSKIKKSESMSVSKLVQGKEGLIRGTMNGKRNNYASRTVSGPDTTLRFGQIRVPKLWVDILTKNVKVADFNHEYLTKLLREGKIEAIYSSRGIKRVVNKEFLSRYTLKIGDSVDRHLQNGDYVSANRQPNLHKYSMMGFEVVLGDQLTIGIHLSYTTPLNADFDGDENNIWNPRDLETEVETRLVHNSKQNIMHRGGSEPVMGFTLNSILASYLISKDSVMIKDNFFKELMNIIVNKEYLPTLFKRLKKLGIHPRSGRAAFSALLPEGFFYEKKDGKNHVKIIDGILVSGNLNKKMVGTVKRSIIQELWRDFEHETIVDFMSEGPKLLNKWLIENGFSVGIGDCLNIATDSDKNDYNVNDRTAEEIARDVISKVESLGGKSSDSMEEKYRERQITDQVNIASASAAEKIANDLLTENNPIRIMSGMGAGSKGDRFNVIQIAGMVGQQYYRGERIKPTIDNNRRVIPCFDPNEHNPEAYGFIPRSFSKGLTVEQLFFSQVAGREGIIDTALGTAKSGELTRDMIKALENIVIFSDGSMRNTCGDLYLPVFNGGYDLAEVIELNRKDNLQEEKYIGIVDFDKIQCKLNYQRGYIEKKFNDVIKQNKQNISFDEALNTEIINEAVKYTPRKRNPINYNFKKLNIFEKTRIIGSRAIQIENNAPPLIMTNSVNAIEIATEEYFSGKLDKFFVCRTNGNRTEKVYATIDNI